MQSSTPSKYPFRKEIATQHSYKVLKNSSISSSSFFIKYFILGKFKLCINREWFEKISYTHYLPEKNLHHFFPPQEGAISFCGVRQIPVGLGPTLMASS